MGCLSCGAENPSTNKFCGGCGAALVLMCAGCGTRNPPTNRFCGECGNRLPGERAGEAPTAAPPSPGGPSLRSSGGDAAGPPPELEGERKQVTVLFADLVGSTQLIRDLDPEDAQQLLDGAVTRMIDAVHRFEGTVSRAMGDGIMALFGAPLALEDHALRASYAALAMQEAIRRYADEVWRGHGVRLQARVGLNSGEVVVRLISDDLHTDYTALGPVVHLASRMEQVAAPSGIAITAETLVLIEGHLEVASLGRVPIKGLDGPIEAFALVGLGPARTRLQAAQARGLARLVGRRGEMDALLEALARARAGHGQVVGLVGEPGVGKSRLALELARAAAERGWAVLEARAQSHGRAAPYLPVVDLLREYFALGAVDARSIGDIVAGRVLELDAGLHACLPALAALLGSPDDGAWAALDARRRRDLTVEAVRRLLVRQGWARPLLLLVEDLHWIDDASQEVLDGMVAALPSAGILLLTTYRPEYRHDWGREASYVEVRVGPLSGASADALLADLLGDDPSLAPAKALLSRRAEGNPLFLEEGVRSLVATGRVVGERGTRRLAAALRDAEVPPTVQSMLAARIDRLGGAEKGLLQAAAVIGTEVPLPVLAAVAGMTDGEARAGVGALISRELLREVEHYPEPMYAFRHALIHDVAYAELLHARRRLLHAAVADHLERLYPLRLDELAPDLARHRDEAGDVPRAVAWYRRAGDRAASLFANEEAARLYRRALGLLAGADGRAHAAPDRTALLLGERLGDVLELAGRHDEARSALLEGLGAAERPTDIASIHARVGGTLAAQRRYDDALAAYDEAERALGEAPEAPEAAAWWGCWLDVQLGRMGVHYWVGDLDRFSDLAGAVRPLAATHGSPAQRGDFFQRLALYGLRRDRYRPAADVVSDARDAVAAALESGPPIAVAVARFLAGFCLLWSGELSEADALIGAALSAAERAGDPSLQARCLTYLAVARRLQGGVEAVRALIPRCLQAAELAQMPEYVGTARANEAWLAWRGDDLEGARRQATAARRAWAELPPGHASAAFGWTATWPLLGVALAEEAKAQALALARELLDAGQQRPPGDIEAMLTEALRRHDSGDAAGAETALHRVADAARRSGYL